MSRLVAEIIVETLREVGVQRCYGIVGGTLNRSAEEIDKSDIEWVHMRQEAGAFAAQAESLVTGNLTAIGGSCGPGSLHFINGVFEARRNRAPVIPIEATAVMGMALYSAKAVVAGRGGDLLEMIQENFI
jgi:pyruvate dehydrogenase (quinone)